MKAQLKERKKPGNQNHQHHKSFTTDQSITDIEKALTAKAEGGLGGHGRGRGGVGDLTRNLLPVVHPRDLQEGSNPSHAIFALIFYRRHFLSRLVQPVCDGDGAALSREAEGEDAR